MSAPRRDFDITWVQQRKAAKAPSVKRAAAPASDAVLSAFAGIGLAAKPHVTDLASSAGLDFDATLHAVLELVTAGDVEIVKREAGGDHQVRLTQSGKQSAKRA